MVPGLAGVGQALPELHLAQHAEAAVVAGDRLPQCLRRTGQGLGKQNPAADVLVLPGLDLGLAPAIADVIVLRSKDLWQVLVQELCRHDATQRMGQ